MKKLKIVLLFSLIIYVIFITKNNIFFCHYNLKTKEIEGIITTYKIDGNYLNATVKGKNKIQISYYFKTENELINFKKQLKIGNKYLIKGIMLKANQNSNFNLFNYRKYLYSKKVYYIMNADSIQLINKNENILYILKNKIIERINKYDSKIYLKLFILGENNTDDEIKESYQNNGISHLFAISGMHITLFTGILSKILNKLFNNKINFIIIVLFLIFYLFLTDFNPSVIRASSMYIIINIKRFLKLKITTQNIIIILVSILLIYNPYYIYNTGFIFSFLVSYSLIIFEDKINIYNNKLVKIFMTSLISFIVGIPIMINNYHTINFLTPLINVLFVPFVSTVLFPLSLITFFIKPLDGLLNIIINIQETLSLLINDYLTITLTFKHMSLVILIIYYIIIYNILKNLSIKNISILLIILLIHSNLNYLNPNTIITVLDIGQGDSILINLPYNKGNILMDTGGKINFDIDEWKQRKKYSISKNTIIPYLKSVGITELDYLILSHGDYDHIGEAINLVNTFKVDKVIFNCGEYNDLEKELINVLEKKNINYYSCIKELNIDKYKLQFLNTGVYDNENGNSSVIYTELNNYKFLFMGDAGVTREKDILEKYNLTNIDFLKVGHHGSNTSSSEEFINSINPKYSLISVGKNNHYGHPKESVLEILNNSTIYRTDLDGSIEIKLNKNGYKIRICSS